MAGYKLKLEKEIKEQEPMFFIVVMHQKVDKQTQVYMHHAVAYTTEEAIRSVMQHMKEKDFELYERSKIGTPWTCHFSQAIPADEMEEMFRNVSTSVREIREKDKQERKNKIMEEIVANKDKGLLHEKIELFTKAEVTYMHDKIKD